MFLKLGNPSAIFFYIQTNKKDGEGSITYKINLHISSESITIIDNLVI